MKHRAEMGRPRKEIDMATVERLCAMHCTGEEIAGFLDVSYPTLLARVKEQVKSDGTHYETFLEYFNVKSSEGKITLRRMQWNSANRGSVPMQIFLGKNLLNQTEKQQIDMTTETTIEVSLQEIQEENDTDEPEGADEQQ